jgi:hypothetical protein
MRLGHRKWRWTTGPVRPRSRTMMEGHSPMHGNGPADAPRIYDAPIMGRDWAAGAFLGRPGPAAACARNRAPAARRGTGTMARSGGGAADARERASRRAQDLKTLLVWDATGRRAHSWVARPRLAPGIAHQPRGGTMRHTPPMHGKGAVDAPKI